MDEATLQDWLDRHHVDVVRTHATNLDGIGIGKYIHRHKFAKALPHGHTIADVSLSMDLAGMPHLTFWHEQRLPAFGDIHLRPDLGTLISDGTDPNLGHCICDFADADGEPLRLCPRSTLKRMVNELEQAGYAMKASFELEFYLFDESFADIRRKQYKDLAAVGASKLQTIYFLRNAYHATAFMNEVTKRLDWKGIAWEGWNDEGGTGQVELNLEPNDPVAIADTVVRTKQILYEVAVDLDMAVTFMPRVGAGYGSGMHIHHSLMRDGQPAMYDASSADHRPAMLQDWIGGLIATLPAAVSFLCPTINSYRRMVDFSAVPMVATWAKDNKSTALRLIGHSAAASRVEYRIGASDLNPYLALAVIIAGGLAGIRERLSPGAEFDKLAWGLPSRYERLPDTISKAAEVLSKDRLLKEVLGEDLVEYWVKSREHEWLSFYTEGGDPEANTATPWEFERYFEVI